MKEKEVLIGTRRERNEAAEVLEIYKSLAEKAKGGRRKASENRSNKKKNATKRTYKKKAQPVVSTGTLLGVM